MTDHRPPVTTGDERATLMALWQFQRESVVRKAEGLTDDEARQSPVASGTCLLWLVRHLAWAESLWIVERFAGRSPDPRFAAVPPLGQDRIDAAIADYRATWAEVDAVIAGADLDDPCPDFGRPPEPDLRWIVAHLLEETARHAGHADIIREVIDGDTGR